MPSSLTPTVRRVALSLMEGLDCPRALTVAILIRYEEWDQLTLLECDPEHYTNAGRYRDANDATSFLKKFDAFDLKDASGAPLDLERGAVEKWFWAERECFKTNRRLDTYLDGGPFGGPTGDARIAEFIGRVQRNVRMLIGSGPPPLVEGRFGPGATVSDTSRMATIPDKMSSVPTLTPSALYYLFPWMGTQWAKASASLGRRPRFVRGDIFFTVPKDSRTERACAKPPSINGFFQLGYGRVMRARLGDNGFDLTDGQTIHRRVACAASISGEFATIDLTSASDCGATSLVKLLLPPSWYEALFSLRCSHTQVGGKWIRLEKFSAMGNGYTFELETTIFAAIAMACMKDPYPGSNVFVYGDDIIVPTADANEVIWALKFFGFTPNKRKTFTTGNFRESCGGDFFGGVAVRPHYLKGEPDEPAKLISLANGLKRLANLNGFSHNRWDAVRRAWFCVLDALPSHVRRCRGPEALGDVVIHDDQERWDTRWRANGIRYLRCWRPATFRKVGWDGFAYEVQFASALYGVQWRQFGRSSSSLDSGRGVVPRDGVTGFKLGWVPYS
jgi:hypothetical protein